MKEKVNVGVIGLGTFCMKQHMPNLTADPLYHIRALCQRNEEKLKKREEEFHPDYVTTNYEDILKDKDIDVVFIVTSHNLHTEMIIKAAEHKKDVLVEKPMCIHKEEVNAILKAVEANKIRLLVGHNRRFAPSMIAAQKAYFAIRDGNPCIVHYRIMDDMTIWDSFDWIAKPELSGGKFLGEVCHIFDLLAWLLKSEPVLVQGMAVGVDHGIANIKFADGSVASIVGGGIGSVYYPKENMEIFCNRHTIVVPQFCELIVCGPEGETVQTFTWQRNKYGSVDGAGGLQAYRESLHGYREEFESNKATTADVPNPDKGHEAQIHELAKAILEGKPSPANEIDGARATIMSLKALEAFKTGESQEIHPSEYGLK